MLVFLVFLIHFFVFVLFLYNKIEALESSGGLGVNRTRRSPGPCRRPDSTCPEPSKSVSSSSSWCPSEWPEKEWDERTVF